MEQAIETAKNELKSKKIKSTLNEFRQLNIESIKLGKKLGETESYNSLCVQLTKLRSIPDKIPGLVIEMHFPDLECLDSIDNIMKTSYTKSVFDAKAMELIKKVQMDHNFYHSGLMKYENFSDGKCPFCNQNLNDYGLYIIDLYKEYFRQEESQIINDIEQNSGAIKNIFKEFSNCMSLYSKMKSLFYEYKEYIPEFKEEKCESFPDIEPIKKEFEKITKALEIKKKDIERTDFDISDSVKAIRNFKVKTQDIYSKQRNLSERLQKALEDSDKSRINLHRKMCDSKYNDLIDDCSNIIDEISELTNRITLLDKSITEKEEKVRKPKKDIIVEDLKKYLSYFFHDKYLFDSSTFGISFLNRSLDKKAKDVLSDGEKSILAFCYYLASTHLLITNEDDYNNLFFIFDDPISSMDFRYVYAVADIIRGLKNNFTHIKDHVRYLILTHNAEFMSILLRNKIPKLFLHMKNGKIEKLKKELLMPYEYHLRDLLSVSKREIPPCHTTPNSIRQVIETIMHFENPNKNSTEEYVRENEILNKNAFIYSVMQDGSHGAVRKQPAISDTDLINAASVIIDFVNSKYPEQINNLS